MKRETNSTHLEIENDKAGDNFSKVAINGTNLSVADVDRSTLTRDVNRDRANESGWHEASYSPTPDNSPIHKSRF